MSVVMFALKASLMYRHCCHSLQRRSDDGSVISQVATFDHPLSGIGWFVSADAWSGVVVRPA